MIFGILIMVHELGHFLVAKGVGIRVLEFSIGLGPKVWSSEKGETTYSLRLLPLGGFNRMAGMEPGDEIDEHGFNKKPVGHRLLVIAAGSVMNFLLAVLFFIAVFMIIGTPSQEPVVGKVRLDSPAAESGFQPGDRILTINGRDVDLWQDLVSTVHSNPGRELDFTLQREDAVLSLKAVPRLDPDSGVGLIGIEQMWERRGLLASIVVGLQQAWGVLVALVVGLVHMITGRVAADVTGPVGIVKMVDQAARLGLANLLGFAGMLSLNLGVINLLPIPALDGSRLVFLGIEGLRGRPIDPKKENIVHLIGFALLVGLMLVITYQDIARLLGGPFGE